MSGEKRQRTVVAAFAHEFERHRLLIDRALHGLSDDDFFRFPGEQVNPIARIVKHLAGNVSSRWSDFLTTDGDKPAHDRDQEFVLGPADTRANLMAAWQHAWSTVAATLRDLGDDDLDRTVTIRGEPHTVFQALLRGVTHLAYHTGQIVYVARMWRSDAPWLTISPGASRDHDAGRYLRHP